MATKQRLRDVMTKDPIVLDASASVGDAARAMRARDVGDVLVRSEGRLCGIVTDRDLVVRVLAEDPAAAASMTLADVCTAKIDYLEPDAEIDAAIRLMTKHAVRRIPIVEQGRPVGIVSLGDLAIARDRDSALGQISAAPPSR